MSASHVRVNSSLARLAAWRSRHAQTPLAAKRMAGGRASFFVANQIIVNAAERDLIAEFSRRYGCEAIPERPLPPLPDGMDRRKEVDMSGAPQLISLRFDRPPGEAVGGIDEYPGRMGASAGQLEFSSEIGAQLALLVARHRSEGRRIGLNPVGEQFAMPLSTALEGSGLVFPQDPFTWPAFGGSSRLVEAWQLVDSVRQIRGDAPVWIAICDGAFWLDPTGIPLVAPGQTASDFGPGVIQWNLVNEGQPAGSQSPTANYHGNRVASAALAKIGDGAGAAGAGGLIARPALFLCSQLATEALRAIKLCVWWGIDILNMSWGFWDDPDEFDEEDWEDTFNWGADNGLVCIAAAGPGRNNPVVELPEEEDIRPATRTPRTLTVGALDTNDQASARSNFGSSVGLWAPGTQIQVAPDAAAPSGSFVNGTSFAAPIVSGVAAMMRYCNPSISADDVRRLLVETGWQGTGRVSRGLNARAAVWAALSERIPDTGEDNSTPAGAFPLLPIGAGGALTTSTGSFSALSHDKDVDYWSFSTKRLSTFDLTIEWYERLADLFVLVEPAGDPSDTADLVRLGSVSSGRQRITGLLPRGDYRVRVRGTGATAYRLTAKIDPARLEPDIFEPNDSIAAAATLLFEDSPLGMVVRRREWGPGQFQATLHRRMGPLGWSYVNQDYYRLPVPHSTVFRVPTLTIRDADEPIDVVLLSEAGVTIQSWNKVRKVTIEPPAETVCFLNVSGTQPTRYWIGTGLRVKKGVLPGPRQRELEIMPKYWGDPPPYAIADRITHLAVEIGPAEREDGEIAFEVTNGLRLQILNAAGEAVAEAREAEPPAEPGSGRKSLVFDVGDLEGLFTLSVRADEAEGPSTVRSVVPPRVERLAIGPGRIRSAAG